MYWSNNHKRNANPTPSKSQHGLPKYEPPQSIMQKDECITSIPMITSKNDNEYDYVLVIKDNPHMIHCIDASRSTLNYRREIMRRLDHAELIVNPEKHRIGDLYLIKIRADDELLEEWAEKMHFLMRLDGSGVYAPFQRTLKSQFQITTFFPDSVFRSSERQLIIHEILHKKEWENGVELNEQILPSIVYMYPLHINNRKNELYWKWNHGYNEWEFPTNINGKKQLIINHITKIFNFLWPTQPLNDIVEYFGEEVGFYFALVEYFIKWLYVPTIAGTVIFFIQLKRYSNGANGGQDGTDPHPQCNSLNNGNDHNPLSFEIQTCESILPYFSLFMTIWTTTFIQFWKRRQIKLAHQWGVLNYEQKDHKTRLSYKSYKNNHKDGNDMTMNKNTIKYNLKIRACKVIVTTPGIFLMVISCIVFMFWFLAMRASIMKKGGNVFFSYVLHTLLWGLIVPLLSGLHIKICQYLNDWENWRTESDHYKYYTAKVCSLLLINTFVAMYYLCCFEQSLPAVAFQVASFMIARLFLDIFVSIVIMPYLRKYKIKRVIQQNKKSEYDPSSIHNPNDVNFDFGDGDKNKGGEDEDKMSVISNNDKNAKVIDMTGDYVRIKQSSAWHQALSPQYDSFKNYCFLILFFGYVSNFSIAFCCAPLVALIGMLFKLRSDRFHLCCNTQRPLPRRVSGIGIWLTVLDQMCTFAIITNMLIIYFTTDNVFEGGYSNYRLQMIIIFEHLLLGIRFGLKLIIPEMPLPVKAEIRLHELTRLKRRKKLLEKAQSQYQHGKHNKKRNRYHNHMMNGDNNHNHNNYSYKGRRYYAEHLDRNNNRDYSMRQCSIHSLQSNKTALSNNSRHHTTNIQIDDFVHAIY